MKFSSAAIFVIDLWIFDLLNWISKNHNERFVRKKSPVHKSVVACFIWKYSKSCFYFWCMHFKGFPPSNKRKSRYQFPVSIPNTGSVSLWAIYHPFWEVTKSNRESISTLDFRTNNGSCFHLTANTSPTCHICALCTECVKVQPGRFLTFKRSAPGQIDTRQLCGCDSIGALGKIIFYTPRRAPPKLEERSWHKNQGWRMSRRKKAAATTLRGLRYLFARLLRRYTALPIYTWVEVRRHTRWLNIACGHFLRRAGRDSPERTKSYFTPRLSCNACHLWN